MVHVWQGRVHTTSLWQETWQHFQALMPGASVKLMRVGGTLAWTSHAYQSDHSSQVVAHGEREH